MYFKNLVSLSTDSWVGIMAFTCGWSKGRKKTSYLKVMTRNPECRCRSGTQKKNARAWVPNALLQTTVRKQKWIQKKFCKDFRKVFSRIVPSTRLQIHGIMNLEGWPDDAGTKIIPTSSGQAPSNPSSLHTEKNGGIGLLPACPALLPRVSFPSLRCNVSIFCTK